MSETPRTGHEVIQEYLRTLDGSPGVYRMLNAASEVLYVGKARNLKARVSNYARPTGHSARIARMIFETTSMMFLTTRTELEALLLEQNLIKQLKPRYNVLLRDDKSFPNILISREHPFAQLKKHRGAKKEKGRYFGPFASAGAVNRTLNQLQKVFLLRNCSDAMFASRTRPCLQYQIKRCAAPCVGRVDEAAYAALVNGGIWRPATLEKLAPGQAPAGRRVWKASTSARMRQLLRMIVVDGTGKKADAPGYRVGGKSVSAEKPGANGYRKSSLVATFAAAFPMDRPRYVIIAMLDEPKGTTATSGQRTAAWNTAPIVGRVVPRIGPLLGVIVGTVFAMVFALPITLVDLPGVLGGWLGPLVENPRLLMAVMMIVLVIIGTALDLTPTILIFAPVMLPIAVKAGIDPVYFGLMFVLNGAIGLITPPVGTVLNVVAGVGRLPMHQVIKGVNPFLLSYTLVLALFVLFPQIVTAPVAWMR